MAQKYVAQNFNSQLYIAQGLSNSTHEKDEHSKGSLIHDNTTEIAIVGNLYASNVRRNPYFNGGSQGIVENNNIHNPDREAVHYNLSLREWDVHKWLNSRSLIYSFHLKAKYSHCPFPTF